MADDLAAIRRANEEKMARLRALEEADAASTPTGQRLVSAPRRAEAVTPAPAPVPAVVAAVPARMGALPARMGALPARMVAVKPLVPASAAIATTIGGGKSAVTIRLPAAKPSPLPSAASPLSPPSPPATRSAFGMRSNTFNASDLFGSSDEDEPPIKHTVSQSVPAASDSGGMSESVSPLKGSPGRASASSSIDLAELRRRAEELDRQTAQRAAERIREAERARQNKDRAVEADRAREDKEREAERAREEREQREERARAEAAEGRDAASRPVETMRRSRQEEDKERAREAAEMIASAGGSGGGGADASSRLSVCTPSCGGRALSPTRAAPWMLKPSTHDGRQSPQGTRSTHGTHSTHGAHPHGTAPRGIYPDGRACADAATQTESSTIPEGRGPWGAAGLDGIGAWGVMHGARGAGFPHFFVPVHMGGTHGYNGAPLGYGGAPLGYGGAPLAYAGPPLGYGGGGPGYAWAPHGYAGGAFVGPWAPYGPAAPPYGGYSGYAALPGLAPGVATAGLAGPHIPIAKVIGILPPADSQRTAVAQATVPAPGVPAAVG